MSDDKQKKRKITPGKLVAVILAVVVIAYMAFNLHVFINFIKLIYA